ncbi:reverse transcriptase domain-containing protein [Tanacetum coccineum]
MSYNAEQTQSEGFSNSLDTGKLHTSNEVTQPRTELYLDELTDGSSGTIIVMICRSWDVHTITGHYLSMDFVMSDAKDNAIHSTAKANVAHNFLRLKEGSIYSIKNFVVYANKEEYRIFRDHAYMIELDGAASVRKTSFKGGGFVRYPFQLKELDVAGRVTNVGRITQQKSNSRTLDFSLANDRWGALGDALVGRKTNNVGLYPVVLTSTNVKLYSNKLYLSSGSSSLILDDAQIPALKALRVENREFLQNINTLTIYMSCNKDEVSLSQAAVHADYSQAKEGTLENLLIWARNRKNDVRVKIDGIRTRKGWNFPSCGGEKCKKGVVRKEGSFWCQACDRAVEYPVLRLELDVSDKTASTMVVMFDEPATELVKCFADSLATADEDVGLAYADDVGLPRALANIIGTTQTMEIKTHTYYEHDTFESFTCWRIAAEEVVEEDAGSSNINTSAEVNIKEFQKMATKPSVVTPSKPAEERGKKVQSNSSLHGHANIEVDLEDLDDEVTCGMDDGQADGKDNFVLDKRKKKRYIVDDSASE